MVMRCSMIASRGQMAEDSEGMSNEWGVGSWQMTVGSGKE